MTDKERKALLEQLARIPARVGRAVMTAADRPRPKGEWSLSAIVGHLLRVEEEVWQARLKQMAKEDNPHWEYWEPDGIDWEGEYGRWTPAQLVERFARTRINTLEYVQKLSDAGWKRIGTHRTFGVLDVAGLCRVMIEHDENHIGQIGIASSPL